MNCPVDDAPLQMTDRNGVEVDYCPRCRGVWLDRGELDKIIERSADYGSRQSSPRESFSPHGDRHNEHHDDDHGYKRENNHYGDQDKHKRKKESFLGDLFDF